LPSTIEGIAIVRWPDEESRAAQLGRTRAPRLLVVAAGGPVPDLDTDDSSVDWIYQPADDRELQTHVVALLNKASRTRPILGDHGVLWRVPTWIALSPIEERLTEAFLARPGRVLSRSRLESAGWPDGLANGRAVDARIKTLRKRLAPAGVKIHTVRGHGYLAEIQ
jgi:DNA-binding response OmpR family regulator